MKNKILFQKEIAENYLENLKQFSKLCPTCKERKCGRKQILSIEKEGECLDCSSSRGELIADRRAEMAEMLDEENFIAQTEIESSL